MQHYTNEPLTVLGTDGITTIANLNGVAVFLPCITRQCEFALIQYGELYSIAYEGSDFTTSRGNHYLAIKLKGLVTWEEIGL